jgi:hypothetical protein
MEPVVGIEPTTDALLRILGGLIFEPFQDLLKDPPETPCEGESLPKNASPLFCVGSCI